MAKRLTKAKGPEADRLTKRDWVRAALVEVGRGGVANVRIEALARELGVTKGSFYWHFKDRDALLNEMLRFWQETSTLRIAEFIQTNIEDPRERLSFLIKVASEDRPDIPGGPIEHALREWARSSEIARRTLSEVDSERLEIMTQIYLDLGMSLPRAKAAALLALSHLIGVNVIHRDVGRQALRSQLEICLIFLLNLPDAMA
ncbi:MULTISPECIES: TetR/AcrR family transcriptional regulator [unclassified Sphingomonas]|uniref:TetR/AcrR family transcriptional regulator n=1 Tax=unclassified Sphingomonas TaxID=196159 RepID=UPI0008360860|nr:MULTISPECIES: TetR/AcrR family transcriptional regulator [unclassified Sphingomonas]